MRAVDVAYAALVEVGRPDLANGIAWFDEDWPGGYLEVNEVILGEADWALITRAETIARQSIGLPPIDRCTHSLMARMGSWP